MIKLGATTHVRPHMRNKARASRQNKLRAGMAGCDLKCANVTAPISHVCYADSPSAHLGESRKRWTDLREILRWPSHQRYVTKYAAKSRASYPGYEDRLGYTATPGHFFSTVTGLSECKDSECCGSMNLRPACNWQRPRHPIVQAITAIGLDAL